MAANVPRMNNPRARARRRSQCLHQLVSYIAHYYFYFNLFARNETVHVQRKGNQAPPLEGGGDINKSCGYILKHQTVTIFKHSNNFSMYVFEQSQGTANV